jgi:hypothetical protein
MRPWLRRLLYLLLGLLWLLVMSLPVFAVVLATQREIQVGSEPERNVRLFLIQEQDAEGVAVQWMGAPSAADGCAQGRVVYLMWEGEGENASFCQCYDQEGNLSSTTVGSCSEP